MAAVLALLAAATALRVIDLGHVPGLNGDEAWYGAMALRWLRGQPMDWRTPTGNLLNPFFFLPLSALHAWFAPSIALLRVPALLSGVVACALNYFLRRRQFDQQTALVSTVLLAILPINLAYSRFAWDASQSLLATVLVLYAACCRPAWRGLAAGLVALAAAVIVHPTNVFAAPLILVPWAAELIGTWMLRQGLDATRWRRRLLTACGWSCLLAVALTPARAVAFVLNYLRLLSGATVYRFIAGSLADSVEWPGLRDVDMFDIVALLLVAVCSCGFVRSLSQRPGPLDRALAWGFGFSLAGFYLVAGPAALQPHHERYAIVLIVPSVLVLSRGMVWWLSVRPHPTTHWCMVAVGWLLLGSFWFYYLRPLETTGGDAHLAFRTAAMEPKHAAIRAIQHAAPGRPVWIVADDWWLYWPLYYLAAGDANLHVVCSQETAGKDFAKDGPQQPRDVWLAQWCESPTAVDPRLRQLFAPAERRVMCDGQSRPLISLTRLHAAADL